MSRRHDVRLRVALSTLLAVIAGGAAFTWLSPGTRTPAATAATAPARASTTAPRADLREARERFSQGVVMLHAHQYEHALTAFHRVLELAPDMPEANVNMGYALIGLGRYAEARASFEGAIELRPRQVNAYYGLAVALEGLKDMPGAIGAMKTYVHLSPAGDPYRAKAMAAIWEWENDGAPRAAGR